jgi:hypothetical protein
MEQVSANRVPPRTVGFVRGQGTGGAKPLACVRPGIGENRPELLVDSYPMVPQGLADDG